MKGRALVSPRRMYCMYSGIAKEHICLLDVTCYYFLMLLRILSFILQLCVLKSKQQLANKDISMQFYTAHLNSWDNEGVGANHKVNHLKTTQFS